MYYGLEAILQENEYMTLDVCNNEKAQYEHSVYVKAVLSKSIRISAFVGAVS